MKITKEFILTADGSSTIFIPEWNEHYHSRHGAVQEAKHVFLKHGLDEKQILDEITLLEIGLGTGLNVFLTVLANKTKVNYIGLEAYPLKEEETSLLNYAKTTAEVEIFSRIQAVPWEIPSVITSQLQLTKLNTTLQNYQLAPETIDLIYFDAFGPRVQPELWTVELFKKLFEGLKQNGIFVTYCAKGQVKRDLKLVGFEVETLTGPPGKREMIRGWKR